MTITLNPCGLLSTVLLCAAASAVQAQAQAKPQTPPHTLNTAGSAVVFKLSDAEPQWPTLRATGATQVALKWTCAKAKDPKLKTSPEMFFKETVPLVDQQRVPSRSLLPKAIAALDFCAEYQVEVDNLGPGSLNIQ
jgi:hypothetical protein